VELWSGYAEAHNNLGLAWLVTGHVEEASACFEKALLLKPAADGYCQLAELYGELGDMARSETALREALRVDTAHPMARVMLANVLRSLERLGGAEQLLRGVLADHPRHARAIAGLGMVMRDAGDLDGAIRSFEHVVELQPQVPESHNDLGAVLLMHGNMDAACHSFRKAIELNPRYGLAYENLASAYVFSQADTEDIARMETLEARDDIPDDLRVSLSFSLGKARADCGDFDASFRHYRRANETRRRAVSFDADAHREAVSRTIECFSRERVADKRGFGVDSELPLFSVCRARGRRSWSRYSQATRTSTERASCRCCRAYV
jgi:tetratricopeptide (TPR) repeat protein